MKFEVRRSKGFEGMAPVARRQVPLRPARSPAVGRGDERLGSQGRQDLPAHPRVRCRQGRVHRQELQVPLEAPGNAIGDFNMIDATSGLIIERDDSEGDPALACKDGPANPTASTCRPS